MQTGGDQDGLGARIVELHIADQPSAWTQAGFTVLDRVVRLGTIDILLTGVDDSDADRARRGITGWTVSGLSVSHGTIDGLRTDCRSNVANRTVTSSPASHPNGATKIDHVVVATPDLERTIAALRATGLECRRIRETESYGSPMRQAFFRLGPTVLEVVSGDAGGGLPAADAPATWFGLAVDVSDLDETAALLGDGLGSIKVAVQDGRRIATLRHKRFTMSVPIAAMDHHADR